MDFTTWMGAEMGKVSYQQEAFASYPECDVIVYDNPKSKSFATVYIKQRIDTQYLTKIFGLPNSVLIVVDSSLVNDKTGHEQWLRAIHALYYGRIYVFAGVSILPLHINRMTNMIECGEPVNMRLIRFSIVDCLYKGFPGKFDVAMFNDPVFWAKEQKPPPREKKVPENEQFWRDYAKQQPHNNPNYSQKNSDFNYDDFRRSYEQYKRAYGAYTEQEYVNYNAPKRAPRGNQWFNAMIESGSLEGAKKVYRKLGLEHHPDHNKSPDATETMKAINQAYEQVKEYFG